MINMMLQKHNISLTFLIVLSFITIAVSAYCLNVFAQESDTESVLIGKEQTTDNVAEKKKFDFQTSIVDPLILRDPFKRDISLTGGKKKQSSVAGYAVDGLSYSNLNSIESIPISKIKIIGVLLGKDRRAMAKIIGETAGTSDGPSENQEVVRRDTSGIFILKEGMLLGEEKAELKAILPGGIVLVEKIRNVYDQEEYLETVIPVSKESVSSEGP